MPKHLNAEETKLIKDGVARRRTPETLIEGQWSVSPLNRDVSVVGVMPSSVTLRDITLRTVEQAPGVWVSKSQREYLIAALIEAGVRSLNVVWGMFTDAKALKENISFMRSLRSDVEVTMSAGTPAHVQIAADAGVDVYTTYAPSIWEFNTIYGRYGRQILRAYSQGLDWRTEVPYPRSEEEQLEVLARDVASAKSLGMRAGMDASMLHYATPDYIRNFAEAAAHAGADVIGLADGASAVAPESWAHLVRIAKKAAPGVPVCLHTHNSFGLGAASAIAGVRAGAEIVEVAVNHLCSGAGQADLAEVAAGLEVLYGVDTGIDLSKLTRLSRLVEDLTGVRMAQNKPVTGRLAWSYSEEAMFEEETFAPVHKSVNPKIFGNEGHYIFGRYSGVSGRAALTEALESEGISLSKEQVASVMDKLGERMEARGRSFSRDELLAEAMSIVNQNLVS